MDLNKKIELVKQINDNINNSISKVWPDFKPFPFILHEEDEYILVSSKPFNGFSLLEENIWIKNERDVELISNTAKVYQGETIALWGVDTWLENTTLSQMSACIAHEMFHAFQDNFSWPYAREVFQPSYPHSPASVALIIEENRELIKILKNHNVYECLEKIINLRKLRESIVGKGFFAYDKGVETGEGTAAYVEIQLEAVLDNKTPLSVALASQYLSFVEDTDNLLNNYRRRLYSSGLILCLSLDIIAPNWQNEWAQSVLTIFDFVEKKININTDLFTARNIVKNFESKKQEKISKFMNQELIRLKGDIQFVGFDPMNITCVGEYCLHKQCPFKFKETVYILKKPLVKYGENITDIKEILIPKEFMLEEVNDYVIHN